MFGKIFYLDLLIAEMAKTMLPFVFNETVGQEVNDHEIYIWK